MELPYSNISSNLFIMFGSFKALKLHETLVLNNVWKPQLYCLKKSVRHNASDLFLYPLKTSENL